MQFGYNLPKVEVKRANRSTVSRSKCSEPPRPARAGRAWGVLGGVLIALLVLSLVVNMKRLMAGEF